VGILRIIRAGQEKPPKHFDMLTEEEIIKRSEPLDKSCFIYFLIKNGEIVHVGQTHDKYMRISQHSREKGFDSFYMLECAHEDLNELEYRYSMLYHPILNVETPRGVMPAPSGCDSGAKIKRKLKMNAPEFKEFVHQHGIQCYHNRYYNVNECLSAYKKDNASKGA